MLRRRKINVVPRRRGGQFLRTAAESIRWPLERAAWAIERGVLWPLQERLAGWSPNRDWADWSLTSQRAGAAALGTVAVVAIVAGALALSGGGSSGEQTAEPARIAIAAPEPSPRNAQPSGPELHGAPPRFAVGSGVGVAKGEGGATAELNSGGGGEGTGEAFDEAPQTEEATASASSGKPVPAGPAAMKVAHRFSTAFVFYEVGERSARAKAVFGETATPELATALGERPPRLPADAKVPKARVVNLVPGPRAGKAYTVSVSLLRVGLTSELRLELNKQHGDWRVTDVRG